MGTPSRIQGLLYVRLTVRLVSTVRRCYINGLQTVLTFFRRFSPTRPVPVGTLTLRADSRQVVRVIRLPRVSASLTRKDYDFLCCGCHTSEYIPEKNIPSSKNSLDTDIYLRVIYSPLEVDTTMELREQKGIAIAAKAKLYRSGNVWFVPSQSASGKGRRYKVDPASKQCDCPDHELRQLKCKHIFAVEYTIMREYTADGESRTLTETVTVKKTYRQEWPAYNAAQTNEKDQFQTLLRELCKGVGEPSQKMGRPRLPFEDMIFSACFKVYSTVSGRRFMSDLRDAQKKGYISKVPHYLLSLIHI